MGAIIPIILMVSSAASAVIAVVTALEVLTLLTVVLAVISVAATVMAVVSYASGDIQTSMIYSLVGIASGIGAIYIGAAAEAESCMMVAMSDAAMAAGTTCEVYSGTALAVTTYIGQMAAGFQTFLQAIHFKVIMGIHKVAYLVSDAYRESIDKIFGQISSVSQALGLGADFMQWALRDARMLILDASAMLGQSYDIGELSYIKSLTDYLNKFSAVVSTYENRPSALLWDLDQWLTKPAIDAKASTIQVWVVSIESALKATELLAKDAYAVRQDVARFVTDMPKWLQEKVKPYTDAILAKFDDFIQVNYDPRMQDITNAFASLGYDHAKTKTRVSSLVSALSKPGQYLRNIRKLNPGQQTDDMRELAALANESDSRELDYYARHMSDAIKTAFEPYECPSEAERFAHYDMDRIETPSVNKNEIHTGRKTPFPGDY